MCVCVGREVKLIFDETVTSGYCSLLPWFIVTQMYSLVAL